MNNEEHDLLRTVLFSLGGIAVFYMLFFLFRKWSRKKERYLPQLIDKHIHFSGLFLVITVVVNYSLRRLSLYISPQFFGILLYVLRILLIIAISFFIIKLIAFFKDILLRLQERREYHDYTLRSVRTKAGLIQRALNMTIIFLTIAAILMTIPQVRKVGNTLLASAGVAGIVIGFAAQKSLSTLFAGIQVAITQPIKIDDTIVIDGIFGTVGEITLTYVVLNTWDEKRLIVPINYFLEKNVENWTRVSPEVVGIVKVYADYSLPVAELREQFNNWIGDSKFWDKRNSALLVTNANEKTMEIRATMTAKNADDAFDLECYIREKMIIYIKDHYPYALPTSRLNIRNLHADK